ncbi:MAG: HipA domain-containing protein [Archangium sp.]|nr:HipA domain-containing protein [Archangium sp.]
MIEEFLAPGSFGKDSSLGGERPKVVLHSVGQAKREMLLKFTPPLSTELGTRWSNLLAFEALCAQTLAGHGIPASGASPATFQRIPASDRAGILLPRFDRPTELGRAGAATLYSLAAERGEFEPSAPKVMASLARHGLVREADAETVALVHSFSAAIGNTDAHLGNYALLFDDAGTASLAPIYDVTAMIFAPRADELPDSRVTPRTHAVPPLVRPLFDTLLSLVDASPHLDTAFKALWLRYVGA